MQLVADGDVERFCRQTRQTKGVKGSQRESKGAYHVVVAVVV